jgi:hypothetical protein
MHYHVINAKYIKDYIIYINFKNGLSGEIDFSNEFDGPIFDPLKDIDYFKSFKIQGHTICWENGADFAPEYLYDKIYSQEKAVR